MRTFLDSAYGLVVALLIAGALLVTLAPRWGWIILAAFIFWPLWKHENRREKP